MFNPTLVPASVDPHRARRIAVLKRHPEVRGLFGYDRRTAWVTVGVVALQVAVAYALNRLRFAGSVWGSSWVMVGVALVIGAVLAHWSAVAIHEATHLLAARTKLGNRAVALLANVLLLLPSAMSFWRYHLRHHTDLGVPGRDNDLPGAFEVRHVTGPWRKLLWISGYAFFAVFARGFWRRPNRWEAVGIALQALVCTALYAGVGGFGLGYLALSVFFGFGIHPVAGHFVHEHYRWEPEQETYSYVGPLNRVNLNIGLHNEHHDFMNVPGARLPKLRALAHEFYEPLVTHRSWLKIYWRFVTDNSMGHHSRFIRPASLTAGDGA